MIHLPTFDEEKILWQKGYNLVIGIDEVGRGSFAGPIVACACTFAPNHNSLFLIHDSIKIDDSKRLKPQERKKAADWIKKNCLVYGIGEVGVATINKVGIGKATAIVMRKAIGEVIKKLSNKEIKESTSLNYSITQLLNIFLLVDAFYVPYVRGIVKARQKAIMKGDQKSISIAAASIIAKVYRDNLMRRLSKKYKAYQWGKNKGYGTKDHQQAIKKNGITRLHRIVFVETFLASQGLTLQS